MIQFFCGSKGCVAGQNNYSQSYENISWEDSSFYGHLDKTLIHAKNISISSQLEVAGTVTVFWGLVLQKVDISIIQWIALSLTVVDLRKLQLYLTTVVKDEFTAGFR